VGAFSGASVIGGFVGRAVLIDSADPTAPAVNDMFPTRDALEGEVQWDSNSPNTETWDLSGGTSIVVLP